VTKINFALREKLNKFFYKSLSKNMKPPSTNIVPKKEIKTQKMKSNASFAKKNTKDFT